MNNSKPLTPMAELLRDLGIIANTPAIIAHLEKEQQAIVDAYEFGYKEGGLDMLSDFEHAQTPGSTKTMEGIEYYGEAFNSSLK